MKITRRENFLLRRALDKASSQAEADMAARALIASLRARGVSSYDIVPADAEARPQSQPGPSAAPPGSMHTEPWQSAAAQEAAKAQEQAWQNYFQAQAQNMTSEQQAAWANMQAQAAPNTYPWGAEAPKPEPPPRRSWLARLLGFLFPF